MLAFETGGVEGLLCITRTIPTPQTPPTIHETIMTFVILHITAFRIPDCRPKDY